MALLDNWLKKCLKIERFVGKIVSKTSSRVYDHPFIVIFLCVCITVVFGYGYTKIDEESDLRKLYVPQDSQLMKDEVYWTEKWGSIPKLETVYLVSDPMGNNIIHEETIGQLFKIHQEIIKLSVEHQGKNYTLQDLCKKHPMTGGCILLGVLDYWNWDEANFVNDPLSQIDKGVNIISHQTVNPSYAWAAETYDKDGKISQAPVAQIMYYMSDEVSIAEPLHKFEKEILSYVLDYQEEMKKIKPKSTVIPYLSCSVNDEVEKSTTSDIKSVAVGYSIMILVLCFTLGEIPSKFRTHPYLSPLGILTTGFGIISGFGLGGYSIKSCSLVTILAFLILAIGVDNLYIIVKNFDLSEISEDPKERVINAMRKSTSIVLTTIKTIGVFIVGMTTPFYAIKYFCVYGAFCMLFVLFYQLTLFVAFLSLEAKRVSSGRHPLFLFIYKEFKQEKSNQENETTENKPILSDQENVDNLETQDDKEQKEEEEEEQEEEENNKDNKEDSDKDIQNNELNENSQSSSERIKSRSGSGSGSGSGSDSETNSNFEKQKNENKSKFEEVTKKPTNDLHLNRIQSFFKNKYCPFILGKKMRYLILGIFVIITIVGIIFATKVESGFDESMVVPDDSYMKDTFHIIKYYLQKHGRVFYLAIKGGTNYWDTDVRDNLVELTDKMEQSGWVKSKYISSWYRDFIEYAKMKNSTSPYIENGWPKSEEFFWAFLTQDFLNQPQYMGYKYQEHILLDPTATELVDQIPSSRFVFRAVDILEVQNKIDFMLDLRKITDASSIMSFVYNFIMFLVEQYVIIINQTLLNIGLSILIVGLITLCFLGHPKLFIIVLIVMVVINIDLMAFIHFADLTIDVITMVSLIMSVGFSIDYSAHICHAYVNRPAKNRELRATRAITEIGSSVVLGGLTTFVGLSPVLIFANSDLFRIIVKIIYATIILGLLHGFVLLPILLTIIGPKTFLTEDEGKEKIGKDKEKFDSDSSKSSKDTLLDEHEIPLDEMKDKETKDSDKQKDKDQKTLDEMDRKDKKVVPKKNDLFSQWLTASSGVSDSSDNDKFWDLLGKTKEKILEEGGSMSATTWMTASSIHTSGMSDLEFDVEEKKND
ncbi:patched domain-containing protein [Anaeramoeba flamelloides]|uniref:Patched domain-containing protein n=1 Tax=Anaeramoeba flamelloides TaxID=1746091 RepID=A0AAV7Y5E0_9EUKA|nr:patched domain-containing protein [Anaeramoeba flamelloides]